MPADIQLRHVGVEFLRPGPPHNQLLSPLTQYLAVCGDSSAGVVTVPYEQGRFERRQRQLRYETGDPQERGGLLQEIGSEMGKILGAVPGLPGALMFDRRQSTLVHLRITLSASELALLPFELAKVPVGPNESAETWLAIQTRPPVCITRSIRSVSAEGVVWPENPRILFVAGDPRTVPYEEHLGALSRAIAPFLYPPSPKDEGQPEEPEPGQPRTFGDLLTVLVNPTLSELLAESNRVHYTHVHFLMHGNYDDTAHDTYGLVFRAADDGTDVVSGERLSSAIVAIGQEGVHRPTVVTLASCDSGNIGSVIVPDASVAHALHQAGVALVVASQFPLSIEASTPLAERLYSGLLQGDHPLVLLQQLRAELHARYSTTWHDWASLVVYEALPAAMDEALDTLKYRQGRLAMNASLERLDRALRDPAGRGARDTAALAGDVEHVVRRLPLDGRYSIECLGLRATSRKRLAQMAFTGARSGSADQSPLEKDPYELLDEAVRDYEAAYRMYLGSETQVVRRVSTLHWVLVQHLSLSAVLGRAPVDGAWEAARLAAVQCLDHPLVNERGWAHGSLAELWALRLATPGLTSRERDEFHEKAIAHARELAGLRHELDPYTITSTCRQFGRYIDWWSAKPFDEGLDGAGRDARQCWSEPSGLLDTARKIVLLLERRERGTGRGGGAGIPPATPPATPSPGEPATKPSAGGATTANVPPAPAGGPAVLAATRGNPLAGPAARGHAGPFFDIEMLPAEHGDCLWIEYGDEAVVHRWLVDCGTQKTAAGLLRRVEALPERDRLLELFVMSHIDADHIGGALPFFKALRRGLRFVDLWFNGWRHLPAVLGARQAEMFSTAIEDFHLPWNLWRDGGAIVTEPGALPEHHLPGGMKLTLLSPAPAQLRKLAPVWARELKRSGLEPGSRVDYSKFLGGTASTSTDVEELADTPFVSDTAAPNGASIALLAEYRGASALLAADAHPSVVAASVQKLLEERGVERLKLDAFKVSHHASQNNLSRDLLQLLDCQRYLVSTNGSHFSHPDREAIARIIKYGGGRREFCFNYTSQYNDVWARADLQERYAYTARYPEAGREGMTVSLL